MTAAGMCSEILLARIWFRTGRTPVSRSEGRLHLPQARFARPGVAPNRRRNRSKHVPSNRWTGLGPPISRALDDKFRQAGTLPVQPPMSGQTSPAQ
jgi:hypothetical protein